MARKSSGRPKGSGAGKRNINGEGSYIKLPNGMIRHKKQCGYKPNGYPRILTVTGKSKTDCKKKMDAKIKALANPINYEDFQKKTLSTLIRQHLQAHLMEENRLKPKAADRRESTIKNQIEPYFIGGLPPNEVTGKDIVEFIEELISEKKLSVSSIKKALDVINSAYKWAISQGYTDYNPCKSVIESLRHRLRNLVEKNSVDGVVHVMGEDEITKLEMFISNLEERNKNTYLFGLSALIMLETGIRVGELSALRWGNYNDDKGTLSISRTRFVAKNRNGDGKNYIPDENGVKNNRYRMIELSPKARELFDKIKKLSPKTQKNDYIILNTRLRPTNPSNYDARLNKLFDDAHMPEEISGAHIFRRTCATRLYNNGCSVEDIAAYLGDTPDTIQRHYISLTKRIVADGEVKNIVPLPTKR